jgi:ribonucleoside-diphosphate reductase alpha chain
MSSVLYEGRARISEIEDIPGMESSGWKNRLAAGIREKGKSEREVSLAAGRGPGYVHSILKENKDPTIDNLIEVCRAAELSLIWVLFGVEMSRETEEIVQALEDASPEQRKGLLQFLLGDENGQAPRALPSPVSTTSGG